jgi:hypothetical protein
MDALHFADDADLLDFADSLHLYGAGRPRGREVEIDKVQAALAEQVRSAPFRAENLGLEAPR